MDGAATAIVIEQEGGSAGVIAAGYIIAALAGFDIRKVKPSANKLTRAMPLLAQAEAGNVRLVRGDWNQDFLDELTAFPGGSHDDQVDAAAHAFNALCASGVSVSFSV
jgi:predicted phage terminase large subunit-like protein